MISKDIGVSEDGSEPLGQSLRLSGTGTVYDDFTWNAPATATSGSVNTGQTFSQQNQDAAPHVESTSPANGATNFPTTANLTVTFTEPVNVTDPWFTLICSVSGSVTAVVS